MNELMPKGDPESAGMPAHAYVFKTAGMTLDHFVHVMGPLVRSFAGEMVRQTFSAFDLGGAGFLTLANLEAVCS
jgi:hypothetical protein